MADLFSADKLILSTLIKILIGIIAGLIIGFGYKIGAKQKYSKNFHLTVTILPAIVAVLISIIGSDIAKAISIGGIFALVRFRSVPGDSKDILYVFFTMAVGLALGVNLYVAGIVLAVVITVVFVLFGALLNKTTAKNNYLKITVPEDLNFNNAFDDLFTKYLSKSELSNVKTTNMGTLYTLTYDIQMKNDSEVKSFIDELRTRNGNLNIVVGNSEENNIQQL